MKWFISTRIIYFWCFTTHLDVFHRCHPVVHGIFQFKFLLVECNFLLSYIHLLSNYELKIIIFSTHFTFFWIFSFSIRWENDFLVEFVFIFLTDSPYHPELVRVFTQHASKMNRWFYIVIWNYIIAKIPYGLSENS